jgi:hypothetical protein
MSSPLVWKTLSRSDRRGARHALHFSSDLPVVCECSNAVRARLRARMQSRSARAKPWLTKSPSAFATSSSADRAASAADRSQLAADILNEDRVALAARLRDPGDDPPPNYLRESNAADDEPYVPAAPPPPAVRPLYAHAHAFPQTQCFSTSDRRQAVFEGF